MLIIGHRGCNCKSDENTLESIKHSIKDGVDIIEIDVQTTSDDKAVLSHSNKLRINNKTIYVSKSTYTQLKKIKPDICLLSSIGNLKDTKFLLDIKPEADINIVIKEVKKLSSAKINLIAASFKFSHLLAIKKSLPDLPLAVSDKWSGVRATSRARKLSTKLIIMNHKWLWRGFIKSIKRSGYSLYAYTVNSLVRAKTLKKHGVDGIITDSPSELVNLK